MQEIAFNPVVIVAVIAAAVAGFSIFELFSMQRRTARHKETLKFSLSDPQSMLALESENAIDSKVISLMIAETRSLNSKSGFRLIPKGIDQKWFKDNAGKSGLANMVTSDGFLETRARLALAGIVLGALLGSLFSAALAFILAVSLGVFGWMLPKRVMVKRIAWRAQQMEHHLPEMLDVIALCMRSGLSFDTSISLFAKHFESCLSADFESARRQWSAGLMRRDDALRNVSKAYDSAVLGRVIETTIRSIRFGSSMADSLESEGKEAKSAYRARREEQVAKTPVKMMIPTGTLILPAMLMLVLGPVLLELMQGGF